MASLSLHIQTFQNLVEFIKVSMPCALANPNQFYMISLAKWSTS